MPIDITNSEFETDMDVILHLQGILLKAAEGKRDEAFDQEYQRFRRLLMDDDTYSDVMPSFVKRYRDLGSLWPAIKSFSPQWEPRRVEVRRQFEPALATAEKIVFFGTGGPLPPKYDSSAWTGAVKSSDRVKAVRTLLPVARNAVERLLEILEASGHNGGPMLDETASHIQALRDLHRTLGELLAAADDGKLEEAFNGGLPSEAVRYAKRAARGFRDDPIPYALSGTILAIMTACGLPGIGGYLTGVALSMKKK